MIFLFYYILFSFSSFIFGQKKLEVGVYVGVFEGIHAEMYRRDFNTNGINYSFISSISEKPSILAGISVAKPFSEKGWQFKTGLDVHTFKYSLFTAVFFTTTPFVNTTNTLNTVVQMPFGYTKRWGDFTIYMGSGLTFFNVKDLSTEKEKMDFDVRHSNFVRSTINNFRTIYPLYEMSMGWRWRRSSIELGYRGTGKFKKKEYAPIYESYDGSQAILYLKTTLLLSKK